MYLSICMGIIILFPVTASTAGAGPIKSVIPQNSDFEQFPDRKILVVLVKGKQPRTTWCQIHHQYS